MAVALVKPCPGPTMQPVLPEELPGLLAKGGTVRLDVREREADLPDIRKVVSASGGGRSSGQDGDTWSIRVEGRRGVAGGRDRIVERPAGIPVWIVREEGR